MSSHYDTLGVTRLSSSKSIKQAYRRIALSSHPDKVSHEQREEATKRFQDIQVAYDVLYDPSKRHAYDRGQLRQDGIHTPPPETDHDGARPWYSTRTEMPPTPESTRSGHWWDRPNSHHSSFTSFDEGVRYDGRPKVMTFLEATLRFHPEDRRHLWLCSDEDDPAVYGENHIVKRLHVSLQEIFSQQTIDVCIFRYRYLEDGTKVVELVRVRVKLKPFLADVAATIDLNNTGNEYPPSHHSLPAYKQRLSILPIDESQSFGDHYDGQFFPYKDSMYDVEVHHTVYKDDLRIQKRLFSFELDIPALSGQSIVAKFKGRFKRGRFSAMLKGEGMWKYYEGGKRGDLYVKMVVK